ncbi:GRAM domain-containing protein [Halopseudomonas sp.]|uniref:GRAM domain-containing protein n=1 Tax=Halopseudomonas sp. TaxID=2901191 RepID=UPI00311DA4D8
MKSALRAGEMIIKEGPANLQKNIETVGGKLYLTNQRLVFEAHNLNVQSFAAEVEISNIQSLEKAWTKFLGLMSIFPNSLSIYTKQGKEFRYVLFGRGAWAAAITATIQGANG